MQGPITTTFWLLLLIGHLGFFDMVYFHMYRCRLHERPECRPEVLLHTFRHLVYAAQFFIVAHFRFYGSALFILIMVYLIDVAIAWGDVWLETESRKKMGGLLRGEYFMHVVLSVLVGAYLCSMLYTVYPDRLLESAIRIEPPDVPSTWAPSS